MAWQKVRITIPPDIPPSIREAIGRDILKHIQDRAITRNTGFNPNTGREKRFPSYTKEYAKRKGSSKSDVDLVNTGEMFTGMDILSHQKGSLLIGFQNGSEDNAKAEGNQLGSYGRTPSASKARPFLGLSKTALDEIVRKHLVSDAD